MFESSLGHLSEPCWWKWKRSAPAAEGADAAQADEPIFLPVHLQESRFYFPPTLESRMLVRSCQGMATMPLPRLTLLGVRHTT